MKIKIKNVPNAFRMQASDITKEVVRVVPGRKYDVRYENWTLNGDTTLMKCYYTKDGQYVDNVTKTVMEQYGVEPDFGRHATGFSPRDKKYYGWSHRACWGFKPGDKIKKGDCAYKPLNDPQSILESVRTFWSEPHHIIELDGSNIVRWSPNYNKLRAKYGQDFYHNWTNSDWVNEFGRQSQDATWRMLKQKGYMEKHVEPLSSFPTGKGEWTIRNWEDAKQAATDFAMSVSKVK